MYNISELSQMCEHLNIQEQKANRAQRESVKYKQCEYLKDKIGNEFNAVISSIQNFGVFVEIIENGCEGLVSKNNLELNNIYIDSDNFCINNLNDGSTYMLGGEIMVKVSGVDMNKKQIDFIIL